MLAVIFRLAAPTPRGVAADFRAQLLRDRHRGLQPRVHQHHQEFSAAVAEHEVAGTTGLVHYLGELAQHLIAAAVPY